MGNLGGGEILVILLVGLLVLGPQRLPTVGRQVGRVITEIRRVSSGFQEEFRAALDDPLGEAEARASGARLRSETGLLGRRSVPSGGATDPDDPEADH
ncbi:uncharacterized protein METZ01_LOCUS71863 [marine metagenome]|uniref:Twin-arginine translocase subunit TatB n=1 Tax=marine metagenome TaxID=408172 RepID=A0A381TT44_9ZZZZ